MTTSLDKIVSAANRSRHATDCGTQMHERLGRITIDAGRVVSGDAQLAAHICTRADIASFFGPDSKREYPVAAYLGDRLVSRRLDRVCIDPDTKTVRILDYKTDVDKFTLRHKYVAQMREYVAIMRKIYPGYRVRAHILWTHDWTLEQVCGDGE